MHKVILFFVFWGSSSLMGSEVWPFWVLKFESTLKVWFNIKFYFLRFIFVFWTLILVNGCEYIWWPSPNKATIRQLKKEIDNIFWKNKCKKNSFIFLLPFTFLQNFMPKKNYSSYHYKNFIPYSTCCNTHHTLCIRFNSWPFHI